MTRRLEPLDTPWVRFWDVAFAVLGRVLPVALPAAGFVAVIDVTLSLLPPVAPRAVTVEVPALPAPLVAELRP